LHSVWLTIEGAEEVEDFFGMDKEMTIWVEV